VGGFAPLSGVILFIILAIIVICSMQWIRRGGHFQVIRFRTFCSLLVYLFQGLLLDTFALSTFFCFAYCSCREFLGKFLY
jgi:hypothetical protein